MNDTPSTNVLTDRPHEPRTLKMCIRAVWDLESNLPREKIIYRRPYAIDLALPTPWTDEDYSQVDRWRTEVRFRVEISREERDFFEGDFKNYLRLDIAAWGKVLGGLNKKSSDRAMLPEVHRTGSSWFDPAISYAAAWLRLGPLDSNELYLDFSLQFEM